MPKRKTNVCDELVLNKVVLRPDRTHSRPPQSIGRTFEPFTTPSRDNSRAIAGWYFPTGQSRALALVNSSNRGTCSDALDHAAMLLEIGCSVLLYDYQGFGDSEGLADVRTLVGDAHGVLAWAQNRGLLPSHEDMAPQQRGTMAPDGIQTDTAPLLLVGLSLGSLVAIRLAGQLAPSVRALVLDGAVEPMRALRRRLGPLGAVIAEVACSQVPDDLRAETRIQAVTCPILMVHGRQDTISTVEDAEYLASRARSATLWVLDDCSHLDIITRHRDEYRRRIEPLLAGPIVR